MELSFASKLDHVVQQRWLSIDLRRACRCTAAFMLALIVARTGWLDLEPTFAALAAHSICLFDVRGPYPLRVGFLITMLLVLLGAVALGSAAGAAATPWAIGAAVAIAVNAGLWRHLTPEYGMLFSIPTGFLFLLALSAPSTHAGHTFSVLIGGLGGVAFQMAFWPFRAQHPLRRAVAESWLAAAKLFETMVGATKPVGPSAQAVAAAEQQLRTALEGGYAVLAAANPRQPMLSQLQHVHQAAGRLAMRVAGAATAAEGVCPSGDAAEFCAALRGVLMSLANTASAVGLAVVSGQPAHLAVAKVRFARADALIIALRRQWDQTAPINAAPSRLPRLLDLAQEQIAELSPALSAVTERAGERAIFPLELFDLNTWTLRPFAAALNLRQRIDPALVRFAARLALLLTLGVLFMRWAPVAHPYWLPLTVLVVSQPDYGTTRQRAVARILGTLIGGILASGLLFLYLKPWAILGLAGVACFGFSYFVRNRYAVAVVFITLFVVLLTEISQHVSLSLTIERLAITFVGGALAFFAALALWPSWERDSYPPLLSKALLATADYLEAVVARAKTGGAYSATEVAAKRAAEAANAAAFASLARMTADPRQQRSGLEQAAVLANGNQRLIRILSFILLNSDGLDAASVAAFVDFARRAGVSVRRLAQRVSQPADAEIASQTVPLAWCRPTSERPADAASTRRTVTWLEAQLARAANEIDAMSISAAEPSDGRTPESPRLPI